MVQCAAIAGSALIGSVHSADHLSLETVQRNSDPVRGMSMHLLLLLEAPLVLAILSHHQRQQRAARVQRIASRGARLPHTPVHSHM